jgi:hypothetical protein
MFSVREKGLRQFMRECKRESEIVLGWCAEKEKAEIAEMQSPPFAEAI